ncbi:MAG: minichromosome maintenance protein MCM [Candidatus Thorarchaeota archaeon]
MTEPRDTKDRLVEFLRTFKDEQGKTVYWDRVQVMPEREQVSLIVDFQDLMTEDPTFVTDAAENPIAFLKMADEALVSVMRTDNAEYVESLDKSLIKLRFINHPDHVKLRAIRARHIGKFINVGGVMMRASEVKPLLVETTFQCRLCDTEIPQVQEDGRYTEPPVCPTCEKKTPLKMLPQKSTFQDWQKVRIQESPEELPAGQMPRSIDVILKGDIVDISRPGDFIRVTGILKTSPDFSRRGSRLATFNTFIEANGVEVSEKEYEQLDITDEEKQAIDDLAQDPFVHTRIIKSIAPSIKGHEYVKKSIALLLFGGREKLLPDGTRLRDKSNILMIGDPGTGKSQILKFVSDLAPRGLYTSGKGTTAAGLTAAVVHDTDSGAMTLEAGALVLADKGIACIDEFDKMDPNDRTAIHEAMEQHTVSIAKAGIVATLNARTSILAAANPTLGRYEPSMNVQDNIRLPFTILSRFDLIWIMVDTVEATKDRALARHILDLHQMKKIKEPDEIPPIDPVFLKKYIGHAAQNVHPDLSQEAADVIEEYYVDMRKQAEGGRAPVPITARQLESLVRLAEAHAKMALRSEVTREDAQEAIDLMKQSLLMVAFNPETGQYDIDRTQASMDSTQRSASDTVLKALQAIESETDRTTVDREALVERASSMGISRDKAEQTIELLIRDGILFSPREGKIRHHLSTG